MSSELVFILSEVRSGSTLLAQLLGAHSGITSVGEMQWLRAYDLDDRRLYNPPHDLLCSCGQTFADCSFWQAVVRELPTPVREMQMMPKFFGWMGVGSGDQPVHHRAVRRSLEVFPTLYRLRSVQRLLGGPQVGQDNLAVLDTVQKLTKARAVVDTSKVIFRFRSIYEECRPRIRVIELYRDYRAVAHSQLKRGIPVEDSARTWALKVRQIKAMTADLPPSQLMTLKYEDLCREPEVELAGVCDFLGLEFEQTMLARATEDIHDLGGSPSKFQTDRRAIVLDEEYLNKLTDEHKKRMRELVGAEADMCGYA